MNKLLIAGLALGLAGCAAKPYEATRTIYDTNITTAKYNLTHVRVHRLPQLTGAALGEDCPLVLKVDEKEIAGLQQNQYVDLYLPQGEHTLSVRFRCALTEWRKSAQLIADGKPREYETEIGAAGQYRMWQTK
ncbi:hypothetical protein [Rahnella selenatireducens]|uniref:hypothetical protein n=1 Tax=Rahnella selenatireducens TaxID=3389797 RepID=UPI00396872B3